MTDFVCVGDVTQDNFFFLDEAEAGLHCELNTDDCELLLHYKDKIPVSEIALTVGGNAANVVVGLSRLGFATELVTTFGGDDRGRWLKKQLKRENIGLSYSAVDEKRDSNLSGIIVYRGERTIMTYHSAGEDLVRRFPDCSWMYLSSTSGRDPRFLHSRVVQYKKDHPDTRLAFNPGVGDVRRGVDYLGKVLAVTDVLVVNREEAEQLLGKETDDSPHNTMKQMLEKVTSFGPKTVVITTGVNGAYVLDGRSRFFCQPALWFKMKETTGAGDAFTSGFLAGFIKIGEAKEAMRWGMVNAGSVVSKVGAQAGLLTASEMEGFLKSHPDFQAGEI